MIRHILKTTAAAGLALGLALPAFAEGAPVQQNNSNAVWFENWVGLSNGWLRVATPDGDISTVTAKKGTPVYELGGSVQDGVYRYELRAAMDEKIKNRDYDPDATAENTLNIGNNEEFVSKPFYRTGYFVVKRGVIVRPEDLEKEEEG